MHILNVIILALADLVMHRPAKLRISREHLILLTIVLLEALLKLARSPTFMILEVVMK